MSSKHTRTTADLQGAVVEFLIPHLGDKASIIGTKESVLIFSENKGLLKPDPLPKDAGRYTVIAPALPKATGFTIFSPGVDSDLALLKQQFAELLAATKQNFGKIEKEVAKLKERIGRLEERTGRLEEENDQLKERIDWLGGENDQLKGENGQFKTRISALEEEVDGYAVIALNAPKWVTTGPSSPCSIGAQLPEARNNAGIHYQSSPWRQQLFSPQDEAQRIQYTTQIVACLDVPTEAIRELANPSSELRIAGDRCMSALSQHLTFASLASIGT
ncbi:hypothetical protein BYT27DRAFT_7264723 [Phlegmacium glaucopus]|nr:hypothetical protein BYT27DRAFT_7264723 [Phlegmacium glaucopus]